MASNLLIDADDTLWENNIYFERAFEEFVEYLGHSSLSPAEIRAALDEIETINNRIHGYGSANFARNLHQCFTNLAERETCAEDLARIIAFGDRLLGHPMEVIEGVEETLAYLNGRHTLVLFTKGHPDEQRLKIDRSGLGRFFDHTAIVKEKNTDAYRGLVAELNMDPANTWMIGNSPKSDVNAALDAGLGAVYIPHAHTWTLEREEIRSDNGRLIQLESFSQLRDYF